ncbi:MAG: hypothetical protein KC561_19360, partial [Myxococcales bacterium]|nr:hypothetical protein [Myxococcales bacterium]
MKRVLLLAIVGLGLTASSAVMAQVDLMGTPTYGTFTLTSGFTPDPATYAVTAGGPVASGTLTTAEGSPCSAGWIASTPDVRIHYDSPAGFPLRFYVDTAGTDPTLAINSPDGQWHCVD